MSRVIAPQYEERAAGSEVDRTLDVATIDEGLASVARCLNGGLDYSNLQRGYKVASTHFAESYSPLVMAGQIGAAGTVCPLGYAYSSSLVPVWFTGILSYTGTIASQVELAIGATTVLTISNDPFFTTLYYTEVPSTQAAAMGFPSGRNTFKFSVRVPAGTVVAAGDIVKVTHSQSVGTPLNEASFSLSFSAPHL